MMTIQNLFTNHIVIEDKSHFINYLYIILPNICKLDLKLKKFAKKTRKINLYAESYFQ